MRVTTSCHDRAGSTESDTVERVFLRGKRQGRTKQAGLPATAQARRTCVAPGARQPRKSGGGRGERGPGRRHRRDDTGVPARVGCGARTDAVRLWSPNARLHDRGTPADCSVEARQCLLNWMNAVGQDLYD